MSDRISRESFHGAFERTLRLVPFARRIVAARPEFVAALEAGGAAPITRSLVEASLAGVDTGDAAALALELRRLRAWTMLTLIHRDLAGIATLEEVVSTVTALAEVAIAASIAQAHREIARAHGEPSGKQQLMVVGMGKLGGGELNVSSDVDLVFLHGTAGGQTGGSRPLTDHEFFTQVGRRVIATLSEVTENGYVFRVDMRLRPFGDSGPLVTSLAALEDYFIGQARPWERYAWLKGRVLNGRGDELEAIRLPFVYRRYLDYGLLESLRDLHGRISAQASRRGRSDDIKVGAGGIREVEFCVQLFQLVRGGRDRGLQLASTRAALAAVGERRLLPAERVHALASAYRYLRRLEHRLQYYEDEQTQALPADVAHRQAIAESMGHGSYETMLAELDRHRTLVQEAFNSLFERRPVTGAVALIARLTDPQATPDEEGLRDDLLAAGLAEPQPVASRLAAYVRTRRYQGLGAACRARIERLVPAAMDAAALEMAPGVTALRLLDLVEAIDRRESYLALLVEYPQVLKRAARLAARSAWAARLLARHPILLDELTHTAASFTATDWPAEKAALLSDCKVHGDDTEHLMDLLRHFKQRHMLRLAIADVEGELAVMALSDELTALADLLLDVVLGFATRAAQGGDAAAHPGFAVVGYGKLGGKELGYGSDLDIVFLYDDSRKDEAELLARISTRVNTWLTSHTAAGVLYETDLRLRPDGASGLLVSSLGAFRDYQLRRAWTWEHQALTRARFCAGDAQVGAAFEQVRREVLCLPREASSLKQEIAAMRAKMRAEMKAAGRDLKHMEGGLVDLEFAVQALVLSEAHRHAALLDNKGNHTLLKRAGELGIVDAQIAAAAADAYLALRARVHASALNDEETTVIGEGELAAEREAVKSLSKAVFGQLPRG